MHIDGYPIEGLAPRVKKLPAGFTVVLVLETVQLLIASPLVISLVTMPQPGSEGPVSSHAFIITGINT
eukprot:scaffold205556_cov30-Attheya_sp.AAC.1